MSSQLQILAGTVVDDASTGSVAWTNPDNAKVSDNVYATVTSTNTRKDGHYLKATNFGFSIPTGATINGILVEVERKKSGTDVGFVADVTVKIVKADGTFGTTNKAVTATDWSTTDTYISYGANNDLWDETWTAENINDVDFGIGFSAQTRTMASEGTGIANVDHIRITVFFTTGRTLASGRTLATGRMLSTSRTLASTRSVV